MIPISLYQSFSVISPVLCLMQIKISTHKHARTHSHIVSRRNTKKWCIFLKIVWRGKGGCTEERRGEGERGKWPCNVKEKEFLCASCIVATKVRNYVQKFLLPSSDWFSKASLLFSRLLASHPFYLFLLF